MYNTQEQELIEINASNSEIIAQAGQQQIANQTDVDDANIVLKHISIQMALIEAKRKTFTQPLNQSLREINSTFKELVKPLQLAKNILTQEVMTWRRGEQEKIRLEQERIMKEEERRRKIQESHKEKGHEVSEPVVMTKPKPLKAIDTTQTRKVWKFEIINAMEVPRAYLTINESRIKEAVRTGVREIPGIKIYQDEIMVIK